MHSSLDEYLYEINYKSTNSISLNKKLGIVAHGERVLLRAKKVS
jgi:hypothetical protein